MDDDLIPVFVAVGQAGARQGQIRWVDPSQPDIATRLSLGYLQRLPSLGEIEPEIHDEPVEDPPVEDEISVAEGE